MSNISFDLSGKIDEPTVAALFIIKRIADSLEIPFFVVGAAARDFLLKHCYGIEPPRITRDIDLGVQVASWEQFGKLAEALKASGEFTRDRREQQRFHRNHVLIDIVPFGPITDIARRISWPPEHEIFLNMMGFQEAYQHSITVRLSTDPEIDVQLPTLPGLALMKLISWDEKYPERQKDAEDLLLIMQKYEEAGNFERLYDSAQDLLQEENFDTRLAGIRLLGRDMARIADPETLSAVRRIIDTETGMQTHRRLIIQMVRGSARIDSRFDEVLIYLEKLKKGVHES